MIKRLSKSKLLLFRPCTIFLMRLMPGLDQTLLYLHRNHIFNPRLSSFFCDLLESQFFYRDRYGYFLHGGQEKFEDSLPDYVMVSFLNGKVSDPWRRRWNLWAF